MMDELHPLHIAQTPDTLTITIPWRSERTPNDEKGMIAFSAGALIFGLGFYWFGLTIIGIIVTLIGILITFSTAIYIFNKTIINVTSSNINVKNRPFPFASVFGSTNVTLTRAELKQVVTEHYNFGAAQTSMVQLLDTRNKAYKVFNFQANAHLADAIEKRIEQFMHIADNPNAVSHRYAEAQDLMNLLQDEAVLQAAATFMDGDISEISQYVRSGDAQALAQRVKSGDINSLIQRIKNPDLPDNPPTE